MHAIAPKVLRWGKLARSLPGGSTSAPRCPPESRDFTSRAQGSPWLSRRAGRSTPALSHRCGHLPRDWEHSKAHSEAQQAAGWPHAALCSFPGLQETRSGCSSLRLGRSQDSLRHLAWGSHDQSKRVEAGSSPHPCRFLPAMRPKALAKGVGSAAPDYALLRPKAPCDMPIHPAKGCLCAPTMLLLGPGRQDQQGHCRQCSRARPC